MVKKDRKHRNEKTEGKAMVVTKKDISKIYFYAPLVSFRNRYEEQCIILIIVKHRFFDLLNGNPFCILLISSLLAGKLSLSRVLSYDLENTAWQVFQKIERSQNQTGPRTVCAANNFQTVQSSIKSTHFIQIQCINNKNPRLMKALKLLVFCPGGLCDSDLKTVVPMWDKWSDLLKDWNLVKVKSAEEVYTVSGIKE